MSLGQHISIRHPTAEAIAHICIQLVCNWIPDRIIGHSGWGETQDIRCISSVPQIIWPELWMRPEHGGHGIDPLLAPPSIKQTIEQLGETL